MSASSAKGSKKKTKTAAKSKTAKKKTVAKKKTATPKAKTAVTKKKAPKAKAQVKKKAAPAPKAPVAAKASAQSKKAAKPAEVKPVPVPEPVKPVILGSGGKPSVSKIVDYLKSTVGETHALLLLSGGLVSSTAAVLAHKALGAKAKIYLLDNGLLRQDESKETFLLYKKLGIPVNIINARKEFSAALKDKHDPAKKRTGIRQAFYNDVLRDLVKQSRAKYLINCVCAETAGSIGAAALNDIFSISNMKPEKPFGCTVLEPLAGFKREAVAKLAKELKLPAAVYNTGYFSVNALAARVAGEATTEKVEIARRATAIIDGVMGATSSVRVVAVVHQELFPAEVQGKEGEGYQVELRCWDTKAGKTVKPYKLAPKQLDAITKKVMTTIPGVVCMSLNITPQPPLTEETV